MSAHTPGPWVHDTRGYPHSDVRGANGRGVAVTWGACSSPAKSADQYRKRTEEDRANARLIAAAPELLEALQKILECEKARAADLRHREAWLPVKFSDKRIAMAEAAIAKATGGKQ